MITTDHIYPPIPWRSFDWQAVFDGDEGEEDAPRGFGAHEDTAVLSLIAEAYESDHHHDEIIELALMGWRAQSVLKKAAADYRAAEKAADTPTAAFEAAAKAAAVEVVLEKIGEKK